MSLVGNDCVPATTYQAVTSLTNNEFSRLLDTVIINSTLSKRASLVTVSLGPRKETVSNLVQLCNLNNNVFTLNKDIMTGCLLGVTGLCLDRSREGVDTCKGWIERVFSLSAYRDVGAFCPRWKSGPTSKECGAAVNMICAVSGAKSSQCSFAKVARDLVFANPTLTPS